MSRPSLLTAAIDPIDIMRKTVYSYLVGRDHPQVPSLIKRDQHCSSKVTTHGRLAV
jgi:hypothetical protein